MYIIKSVNDELPAGFGDVDDNYDNYVDYYNSFDEDDDFIEESYDICY